MRILTLLALLIPGTASACAMRISPEVVALRADAAKAAEAAKATQLGAKGLPADAEKAKTLEELMNEIDAMAPKAVQPTIAEAQPAS